MQSPRKPGNYWADFTHVEAALLAFIKEHGTPGIIPTDKELLQAGRGDLAKAIRKHNGVEAVAERLGLQLPAHKRKRRGFWDDFANVKRELFTYIEKCGTPAIMPKQSELAQAGYGGLVMAIDRHGGIFAIAQQLGLQLAHAQHPDGYWDNFATIEHELFAYIEKHGAQGVIPSRAELIKAGLGDLAGAFDKYGGSSAVAERLGLQMKIKPMGHWDDFTNVETAISAYIAEYGTPGVMPSLSALQKAGQNSLVIAITKKHGGLAGVAQRLGLQLSSTAKPSSYWDNNAHIELAIQEFNAERGMPGIMPTSSELQKAGRGGLVTAITNHGGFPSIAEKFGLTYTYTAKPDRYWDDFENVQREIFEFIQIQGIVGTMPTSVELQKSGKQSLVAAISSKHGGFSVVAERLGLAITKKPNGYWDDFTNLEQELLTFIQEHGKQGVMPTNQEFYAAKRSDLSFAIHKHGGVAVVRERLGLCTPPKRPGPWDDFSRVEVELG